MSDHHFNWAHMSKYNEGQISNPEELQDLIQEAAKLKTAQLDYKVALREVTFSIGVIQLSRLILCH